MIISGLHFWHCLSAFILSIYSLKLVSKETTVMSDSLFTMGYKKNTDFISRSVSSFSPDTLKLHWWTQDLAIY